MGADALHESHADSFMGPYGRRGICLQTDHVMTKI